MIAAAAVAVTVAAMPLASTADPTHAIAMVGEPALPQGFAHLPYANPDAPRGGAIRLAASGGFDSLKPWVLKGTAAEGVAALVTETLMYRSIDEPFTLYGLLAESVETDPDRSWVEFTLRPQARFSDGSPVTIADVIWSFETLGTSGHPRYQGAWAKVDRIEQTGERKVRLTFNAPDRELALLMGLRPILKKAQWQGQDFAASSLEPPIGSGPYVVDRVDPGRSVSFRRNPEWWAKDLPIARGLNNFDAIRYDYFADSNAMFEAFKGGEIDLWREQNPARWEAEFGFPAVASGAVVKEEVPHGRPSGIIGLVMNTRSPLFSDWRVRQALIDAFNFQFINKTLTAGKDPRITSYFSNSFLAAGEGPARGAVAEMLAPYASDLLPGTLAGVSLPSGSDTALDRKGLRAAMKLLEEAGWTVQDGVLKNAQGRPFTFEILLNQSGSAMRSSSEVQQIVDIYLESLRTLGIAARATLLDSAQYIQRTNNYAFDMTWYERALSLSPGNEQMLYWGSKGVTEPGSKNWMGMDVPAAEAMVAAMVGASDGEAFTNATRALDRILTAGRYVIPVSFAPVSRLAYPRRLKHPEVIPLYGDWPGWMPDVWWSAD